MARLLVIDDNQEFRRTLVRQLVAAGHETIVPPAGRGALAAAVTETYDLAITDVVMPEADGIEIVRAIKAARPGCPIIAISGGSPLMPADFGLRLTEVFGADAVLYKPFMISEMIEAINRLTRA